MSGIFIIGGHSACLLIEAPESMQAIASVVEALTLANFIEIMF